MRTYAMTKYKGTSVPFDSISERKQIIGKRVGFDLRSSILSHVGIVQSVDRYGMTISGCEYAKRDFQQVVLLDDQNLGGEWK